MSRERYEVREGDKIWPIIEIIRNTWYDDLTTDRVKEVVALIDSWRITDSEGRLIARKRAATALSIPDRAMAADLANSIDHALALVPSSADGVELAMADMLFMAPQLSDFLKKISAEYMPLFPPPPVSR